MGPTAGCFGSLPRPASGLLNLVFSPSPNVPDRWKLGGPVRILLLCVTLTVPSAAAAYDIYTNTPVMKLPAVHEAMTGLAEVCFRNSPDPSRPPKDCWTYGALAKSFVLKRPFSALQEAVRWPDDPTRQGNGFTYPKLGLSLRNGCPIQTAAMPAIDQAGLLCSSHYGRLQFLHAMRSPDDRSDADTRASILDWARFAYEVAAGDSKLIGSDLCAAVSGRGHLATAMEFADQSLCHQRRSRWRTYPPYTVRTFFTLRCSNMFSSRRCWEQSSANGDEAARIAATGALLHLVQDSYSQAHTSRSVGGSVNEKGPFEAKVVCRPPTTFFNYSGQNHDEHGRADLPPARDSSCNDGAIDDPITASATVLWHLENKKSADEFVTYLKNRVFGT